MRISATSVLIIVAIGCGGGGGGSSESATTTASTASTSSTSVETTQTTVVTTTMTSAMTATGSTSSGGETDTEDTGSPPLDLDCPEISEIPMPPFDVETHLIEMLEPLPECSDIIDLSMGSTWSVLLTHPSSDGAWASGKFPLVIFDHGNGQFFDAYPSLFGSLAELGFLVASLDSPEFNDPPERAARMVCTARWFAEVWPERNERLSCDLAFMGHSAGGQGAARAAGLLRTDPTAATDLLRLKAVVAIAPRGAGFDKVGPELAAPLLAIQGSRDEQVPGGAQVLFHRFPDEEMFARNHGRSVIWADDVEHDAFGGGGAIEPDNATAIGSGDFEVGIVRMKAKGEAIAREYVTRFLRWKMFADDPSLRAFFTGEAIPPGVDLAEWWNYLPDNEGGAPRLSAAFIVDEQASGEERLLVDTFWRDEPQAITPASPSDLAVVVSPFNFLANVQVDTSFPLANGADPGNAAMRVQWGPGEAGSVSWIGLAGLEGSSFLSLRVANVLAIEPADADVCDVQAEPAPVSFSVSLSDGVDTATVALPALSPQDFGLGRALDQPARCKWYQFMRTIRIPLNAFCQNAPIDLDAVDQVTLSFGAGSGTTSGVVLLDALEFTSSSEDVGGVALCP